MRRVALVMLALMLCGCMKDQAITHATCKLESMSRNFNSSTSKEAIDEIVRCMSLNGYTKRISKYCPYVGVGDASTPCYQPDSWLGRIGYQIEMVSKSN